MLGDQIWWSILRAHQDDPFVFADQPLYSPDEDVKALVKRQLLFQGLYGVTCPPIAA